MSPAILTIAEYSNKSIVVRGATADDTRSRKEELKNLGGKFNPRLRAPDGDGTLPGWIFSKANQDMIQKYVHDVNTTPAPKRTRITSKPDEIVQRERHGLDCTDYFILTLFAIQIYLLLRISMDDVSPVLSHHELLA
jgi:hypothetical protein